MSAPPAPAGLPPSPDPQDRAAGLPNLTLLLGIVRMLIGFGRALADSLQDPATQPSRMQLVRQFGIPDLRQVLTRIARGLLRANVLEARLLRRAARGRDAVLPPAPMPRLPGRSRAGQRRPPHRPQPPQPQPFRLDAACLARLARLARSKPIGDVIVDICLDFGIWPGTFDDPAARKALQQAIMHYNGNLGRWVRGGTPRPGILRPNPCNFATPQELRVPPPPLWLPAATLPPGIRPANWPPAAAEPP